MITSEIYIKTNTRLTYIDSLRGFAVIIMVQQHLQSWLWNVSWMSYPLTWPKYPVMLSLHFTGWFAAPIFVILAGTGVELSYETEKQSSAYIKRGLKIIACGYLLNFIIPNWFAPGSWYVLHTIGISILLSPLLLQINTPLLFIFTAVSVFIPAFLQTWLNTALMQGNLNMNTISLPGGILRIAFVEGHFPVFPWIGFFTAGIVSRRIIRETKINRILYASILIAGIGIFLASLYNHGYFFATGGKLFRIFVPLPYFYPPLPPFIFFIMGISLFKLYCFIKFDNLLSLPFFYPLSTLGRSSLSWFIIHIFIFNQLAWITGLYKTFNAVDTLLITFAALFMMIYLSIKWQKYNFRYGIERFIKR